MMDALLKALAERTYSRSDFSYRISVMREFLEYVFFTKHDARPGKESIEPFTAYRKKPEADALFLQSLPESFFESFGQDSFYELLETLAGAVKRLPTLSLTVPVVLSHTDVEAIGTWARKNVDPEVMLEIDIEASVAVGCQIVWKDQLHDYALNHYLALHAEELHKVLLERTSPSH